MQESTCCQAWVKRRSWLTQAFFGLSKKSNKRGGLRFDLSVMVENRWQRVDTIQGEVGVLCHVNMGCSVCGGDIPHCYLSAGLLQRLSGDHVDHQLQYTVAMLWCPVAVLNQALCTSLLHEKLLVQLLHGALHNSSEQTHVRIECEYTCIWVPSSRRSEDVPHAFCISRYWYSRQQQHMPREYNHQLSNQQVCQMQAWQHLQQAKLNKSATVNIGLQRHQLQSCKGIQSGWICLIFSLAAGQQS